jgi:uncharacterized tellurite resistance protein B-like protein
MSADNQRLGVVTDLLLGAAHADTRLAGQETTSVRQLLRQLTTDAGLLAAAEARFSTFSKAKLDVKKAAAQFNADPLVTKRQLLELIARVTMADEELDFDEDAYLQSVAKALGMQPEEYSDLTLDYEAEELQSQFIAVVAPPPVPKG